MLDNFRLNVPLISQQHLGYCLPACVQMVLEYYGIQRGQEDLAKVLGVVFGVGVTLGNVRRITSRQIEVRYGAGEKEDLFKSLAEGIPPILDVATENLNYWEGVKSQHVVLLAATEDSNGVLYAIFLSRSASTWRNC